MKCKFMTMWYWFGSNPRASALALDPDYFLIISNPDRSTSWQRIISLTPGWALGCHKECTLRIKVQGTSMHLLLWVGQRDLTPSPIMWSPLDSFILLQHLPWCWPYPSIYLFKFQQEVRVNSFFLRLFSPKAPSPLAEVFYHVTSLTGRWESMSKPLPSRQEYE